MPDKKKDEKVILFFDDTVDIGKEPQPMKNPEHERIFEELMKKYKVKQKALCSDMICRVLFLVQKCGQIY